MVLDNGRPDSQVGHTDDGSGCSEYGGSPGFGWMDGSRENSTSRVLVRRSSEFLVRWTQMMVDTEVFGGTPGFYSYDTTLVTSNS